MSAGGSQRALSFQEMDAIDKAKSASGAAQPVKADYTPYIKNNRLDLDAAMAAGLADPTLGVNFNDYSEAGAAKQKALYDAIAGDGVKSNWADSIWSSKDNSNRDVIRARNNFNNWSVQQAKAKLEKQQLAAADEFTGNLDNRIGQEVSAARQQLSNNLVNNQRSLRGQATGSGMLFSGRRQKYEGELANEAGGQLAQARGDVVNRLTTQAQQMYTKPIGSKITDQLNGLRQQAGLGQIQNNINQSSAATTSSGMGLIGQGLGRAAGDQNWFGGGSTNPQLQQNGYNGRGQTARAGY